MDNSVPFLGVSQNRNRSSDNIREYDVFQGGDPFVIQINLDEVACFIALHQVQSDILGPQRIIEIVARYAAEAVAAGAEMHAAINAGGALAHDLLDAIRTGVLK